MLVLMMMVVIAPKTAVRTALKVMMGALVEVVIMVNMAGMQKAFH
jgi:hypothetical protein